MRNLIIFGLLIIILVAAQFTPAKSVDEVIAKYIKARGGIDQLLAIQIVQLEGTQDFMGRQEFIRIIKTQDAGDQNFRPINTETSELKTPEESFAFLPVETDLAGPLVEYVSKGHKAELLGKEIQEGHNCYKIRLITGAGGTIIYWIDTATYLPNRCLTIYNTGELNSEILTIYRNYQNINGIPFAYTREIKISHPNGDVQIETIHFHHITLNPAEDSTTYNA